MMLAIQPRAVANTFTDAIFISMHTWMGVESLECVNVLARDPPHSAHTVTEPSPRDRPSCEYPLQS